MLLDDGRITTENMVDELLSALSVAEARIQELEAHIGRLQFLVDQQAEDVGLWFVAATAPEAYLQRAIRDLHTLVETTGEGMS